MRRLLRSLRYLTAEALLSLSRSWRISVVAVLTVAVSLFLCGGFLIVFRSLSTAVDQWRDQLSVVVYLTKDADRQAVRDLQFLMETSPWVEEVVEVDAKEAARRFQASFPGLAEMASGLEGEIFPPSLEASIDTSKVEQVSFDEWIEGLRAYPVALMVDADREWLDQLARAVDVLRAGGMLIGFIFLAAAALTTASILRLIAYLYSEEIAIMRVIGATELHIRGPFYLEGMIQGLAGSLVALGGIVLALRALPDTGERSLWGALFLAHPLGWREALLLLGTGAVIGAVGAMLSLRRERPLAS